MPNNKLKNTIVLKGIASNIVEEAIVVLKPNVKLKVPRTNGVSNVENKRETLILKEAENIVNDYVNLLKKEELLKSYEEIKLKLKKIRIITIMLFIALVFAIFK